MAGDSVDLGASRGDGGLDGERHEPAVGDTDVRDGTHARAAARPWAGADDRPAQERIDEFLLDLPERAPTEGGALAGWAAGRRARIVIGVIVVAMLPGSLIAYRSLRRWAIAQRTRAYQLPESTRDDPRSREMTWNEGWAQLGLEREWPGVEVVHLPDRDVVLAEGCDRAFFSVRVVDGEVVSFHVQKGDVVQIPRGPGR